MKIGVIIPIKKFTNSKQRLSSILTIDQRRKLSQCMLLDICDILISSKCFAQILIVSSEDEIHKYKNDIDITFLKEKYDKGVNHAVESGNKYFIDRNFESTIVIPGDIPLINEESIKEFVNNTADNEVVISPSINKNGTNMLFRKPPDIIKTAYDENSYFNHLDRIEKKNLRYLVFEDISVMLDLDEPDDVNKIFNKLRDSRTKNLMKEFNLH